MPDDDTTTTDTDDTTADDQAGDGTGGDGTGGDGSGGQDGAGLGEGGRKALDAERRARREAERQAREAKAELARLQAQSANGTSGSGDGDKPDAEQIRREAEDAATKRANERILRSEIRAAAAGKLADPADALAHLNLADFEVTADGTVDEQHIADAISDLLKRKPYLAAKAAGFQGTGDGGAAGRSSGPKQLSRADIRTMKPEQIEKARQEGRLDKLLAGG